MTVHEAISTADRIREGNAYSESEKISWLNAVDGAVNEGIIKRHVPPEPKPAQERELAENEEQRAAKLQQNIDIITNRRNILREKLEAAHGDLIDEELAETAKGLYKTSWFSLDSQAALEVAVYAGYKSSVDDTAWNAALEALDFAAKKAAYVAAAAAYSEAYSAAAAKVRQLASLILELYTDDGTLDATNIAALNSAAALSGTAAPFQTLAALADEAAACADIWFDAQSQTPDEDTQDLISDVYMISEDESAAAEAYAALQTPIRDYYIAQKIVIFAVGSLRDWETAYETELVKRQKNANEYYDGLAEEIRGKYSYPAEGYDQDTDADHVLLIPEPWSQAYVFYLLAQIDYFNQETFSYNNNMSRFNAELQRFFDWYNKKYKPVGASQRGERDIKWY